MVADEKTDESREIEVTECDDEQNPSSNQLEKEPSKKLKFFDEYTKLAKGILWFGIGENYDLVQLANSMTQKVNKNEQVSSLLRINRLLKQHARQQKPEKESVFKNC